MSLSSLNLSPSVYISLCKQYVCVCVSSFTYIVYSCTVRLCCVDPLCISDTLQFPHWTKISKAIHSSSGLCRSACGYLCICTWRRMCVACVCFFLDATLIFDSLDIGCAASLLILFAPIMEINLHPFAGTRPCAHTYTVMQLNLHTRFSIGSEVSIPQASVPFTLKAQLYRERYIKTCEWLLDIPVEKLTVNWKGSMSFTISVASQCKNELYSARKTVQTLTSHL